MTQAKCFSAQDSPIQPPCGNAGAIEFKQLFEFKSGCFADSDELLRSIAAAMAQDFVEGAKKFGAVRNEDDGAAAVLEDVPNTAQGFAIVGKMLDDIEANHGIEGLSGGKEFTDMPST